MLRLLLISNLFFIATLVHAQFGLNVVNPEINNPSYLADLDGDGINDLVEISTINIGALPFGHTLSWRKGINETNFSDTIEIRSDSLFIRNFFFADIDNDGDQDLIFETRPWRGNSLAAVNIKIEIAENINNGPSFRLHTIHDTTYSNTSAISYSRLTSTDLNGDGNLDLLLVTRYDSINHSFELFLGDGNLHFLHAIPTSQPNAFNVFAEDLDLDGKNELISSSSSSRGINIYDYDSTTNQIQLIDSIINSQDTNYLICNAIEDFDSDGFPDIMAMIYHSFRYAPSVWIKNLGQLQFDNIDTLINNTAYPQYYEDIDQDGQVDFLYSSNDRWFETIYWARNNNGVLSAPNYIFREDSSIFQRNYQILNGNHDHDLDLYKNSDSRYVLLYFENFDANPYKYQGLVFFDENNNGIKDSSELGLNHLPITIQPSSSISYSSNGTFLAKTDSGSHTIFVNPPTGFKFSTDSTYTLTVNQTVPLRDSILFGFSIDGSFTDLSNDMIGQFPRCNDTISYFVEIKNKGNTILNSITNLQLDSQIVHLSSNPPSTSYTNGLYHWQLDSITPFQTKKIEITIIMPDFNSANDTLSSNISTSFQEVGDTISLLQKDTLHQIVRCALDPNDKTAYPVGLDSGKYISQDQRIEYLIRFQNTGNDTAINVLLVDKLNEKLDLNSIEIISSSHEMNASLSENGEMQFRFDNIMLVDSNTNEPHSHGFVKFAIKPKGNLMPNTKIANQASIYFDYNPAIITNEVYNRIECYDTSRATILAVDSFTLEANFEKGQFYYWYKADSLVQASSSKHYTAIDSGIYRVRVIDSLSCLSPYSKWHLQKISSLKESLISELFMAFPNPFSQQLHFKIDPSLLKKQNEIRVYNQFGQLIYEIVGINQNSLSIETRTWANGMYFIELKSDTQYAFKKLILSK